MQDEKVHDFCSRDTARGSRFHFAPTKNRFQITLVEVLVLHHLNLDAVPCEFNSVL